MSNKKVVSLPQPDAPKVSASPLQAISPNPFYQQSFLGKYGYTGVGAVMGGSVFLVSNYLNRRPLYAGIHLFPIGIVIGASLLYGIQKYKENQWAERDAIFRHYISLHPEDFPPYKQVKIGAIFEDWTPIR